jgi:hypothetical protein
MRIYLPLFPVLLSVFGRTLFWPRHARGFFRRCFQSPKSTLSGNLLPPMDSPDTAARHLARLRRVTAHLSPPTDTKSAWAKTGGIAGTIYHGLFSTAPSTRNHGGEIVARVLKAHGKPFPSPVPNQHFTISVLRFNPVLHTSFLILHQLTFQLPPPHPPSSQNRRQVDIHPFWRAHFADSRRGRSPRHTPCRRRTPRGYSSICRRRNCAAYGIPGGGGRYRWAWSYEYNYGVEERTDGAESRCAHRGEMRLILFNFS